MTARIEYMTTPEALARYTEPGDDSMVYGTVANPPSEAASIALRAMADAADDTSTIYVFRDWERCLVAVEENDARYLVTFDVTAFRESTGEVGHGGVNHPSYMPVADYIATSRDARDRWWEMNGTAGMGHRPIYVAWEMGPALAAVKASDRTWNGFVIPHMTYNQVAAMMADADRLADAYPEDIDRLAWDGRTLVVSSPACLDPTHPEGFAPVRIDPNDDGLYVIDLGWTFNILDGEGDALAADMAATEAFRATIDTDPKADGVPRDDHGMVINAAWLIVNANAQYRVDSRSMTRERHNAWWIAGALENMVADGVMPCGYAIRLALEVSR